jgi:hydrogenase-1 operon protein HyaF
MLPSIDEACHSVPGSTITGNVVPLLHEVRHALQALLEQGTETFIDLRAIPLGPGEEERIAETLGKGEVQVLMSSLGPSEIIETRFPGVWMSTHHNQDGEVIGRYIEICLVPPLVRSQEADIRHGLQVLDARLQE